MSEDLSFHLVSSPIHHSPIIILYGTVSVPGSLVERELGHRITWDPLLYEILLIYD